MVGWLGCCVSLAGPMDAKQLLQPGCLCTIFFVVLFFA
jgi:hypothetical protein